MSGIGEDYTCECCGGTFTKVRSDEEAAAEALGLFPLEHLFSKPPGIVCDDCFRQIMDWARVNMPESLL